MSENPTYMAEMTVVEVRIEMPDGRIARGRARVEDDMKIHPDRIEWRAVTDAFESACALLRRMSGEPCDCGVYDEDGRDTGIHHSTTCAMFRQGD